MFKSKIAKMAIVLTLIATMLFSYATPVLAVKLTSTSEEADLIIVLAHEGGPERSGLLNDRQKELYDQSTYEYIIGKTVYKIIDVEVNNNSITDFDYQNELYCLDATKVFPGVSTTSGQATYMKYKNVADLFDGSSDVVKTLHLGTEYNTDSAAWTGNYKAIVWLLNNMYLSKQAPEQKADYLNKAFADYDEHDVDTVMAVLTDDDIEVVQQRALWYFTNADSEDYNQSTLPMVQLKKHDVENLNVSDPKTYAEWGYEDRQDMANHLFQYLVEKANAAKTAGTTEEVTYPAIIDTTVTCESKENHYAVGPFKVRSGNTTDYTIKVIDEAGNEVSAQNYELYDKNGNKITKPVKEVLDTEYYIYIPKTNETLTQVGIQLEYSDYSTKATLWKNVEDTEGVYQPVVLITKETTPHKPRKLGPIVRDQKIEDLALRKYIVSVNGERVNRAPTVDVNPLKNNEPNASYKHAKNPVQLAPGDKVVFEIRVYNEGTDEATGIVVKDALPKGLEFVPKTESSINSVYDWEIVTSGNNLVVYKTNKIQGATLDGFNRTTGTTLDSAYVQMECKVSDQLTANTSFTNIAEIMDDSVNDKDSQPSNNDYINNDNDTSTYTGNKDNKEDLSDSTYFYEGIQDDDDFEKVDVVIPEVKPFDLAAKKFISKINGKDPETSRVPSVDVRPLQNNSTDAKYTTVKTPLVVQKGDIVTYTIRVYNEGQEAGYAEEVADFLPEGLGFLVNYTGNVENYWSLPSDAKTVKLSTIDGGTRNLKVSDFTGVTKLEDVEVLPGKAKITSNKLKSNQTDEKNLINGFDPKNGTTLAYKDIQVTCIVLADKVNNNNFRNIAEVTKNTNKDKEPVTDRDSTPDSVNPDNYPDGEERRDGTIQDDNDSENLTTVDKRFDLSLEKFITKVNGSDIKGREPKLTKGSDGKIKFTKTADALAVENNDLITYTIRVYNEGTMNGYAEEVSDNIPEGLVFVKDNETNKKYGWKMYDKNGKETTDEKQAVSVKTTYLSKESSEKRNESALIKAFNPADDVSKIDYKDVELVFRVDQSVVKSQDRKVKNIAEITDDADENGNEVEDMDSTPGNNNANEDDIDQEVIHVKYFDLSLRKDLVKIIVVENGQTREIAVDPNAGLQKVEIHRKRINSTVVKFVYNITVKNEGEIAGYATEIKDYVPNGLKFVENENKQWTKGSGNEITTNALANTLLQPGQTATVSVTLQWVNGENNFGLQTNVAEISQDKNDSGTPDIDSTPNNKKDGEDDIDKAEIMLAISTGSAPTYIGLSLTVLMILTTGIALIKKYVLY